MSWNDWWRWAKLWAVLLSTLWGDASTAYGKSRVQQQVRQTNLTFSTDRAGCQWDHVNLNCRGYAVISCLNLMNLLTQSYSFQPSSQAVQVSAGRAVQPLPFTHSQTAYFEWLGKGNQTVHLGRCCFGEAGGSTAACTFTSSTMTPATNIFISVVQQWELGAAANKLWLPAWTPSLLTSDPNAAANTMLNWEEQRWVWVVVSSQEKGILG